MTECENYIRIDGHYNSLSALQAIPFEPLSWFPWPGERSKLEYMLREFGCRWLTDDADKQVHLQRRVGDGPFHRRTTYLEATFNTDSVPPLPFYRKLISVLPDIQITYEYFNYRRGIVGHGHINASNAHKTLPVAYAFGDLGELAAIRSARFWYLWLAKPGHLPPAPWDYVPVAADTLRVIVDWPATDESDDDGDWTMV